MRSAVITLASTPMPMARMIPAIPGRVSVKLDRKGKKPDTAATDRASCPIRANTATTPGSRYRQIMKIAISTKATAPAMTIESLAPVPRVGSIVE